MKSLCLPYILWKNNRYAEQPFLIIMKMSKTKSEKVRAENFNDDELYTDEELDYMKQQRLANWLNFIARNNNGSVNG